MIILREENWLRRYQQGSCCYRQRGASEYYQVSNTILATQYHQIPNTNLATRYYQASNTNLASEYYQVSNTILDTFLYDIVFYTIATAVTLNIIESIMVFHTILLPNLGQNLRISNIR